MDAVRRGGSASALRQVHRGGGRCWSWPSCRSRPPKAPPRSSRSRPRSRRSSRAPGRTCSTPARCSRIGLFTERAYCRFFCPLGGVLAALDRFHLLDRLRRRAECGSPCRLCEAACPVRAIEKSGKIVTAECFQCLDCQVEYFDDQRCPPLVAARRLASGRATARRCACLSITPPPRLAHPRCRRRPAAADRRRARDRAAARASSAGRARCSAPRPS